jgi:aminoacyl tRNA synthase complex-interacting multifunctional protein 1
MTKKLTLSLDESPSSTALHIYVELVKCDLENTVVEYKKGNDIQLLLNEESIALIGAVTIAQFIDRRVVSNTPSLISRSTALESCQLLQWIAMCQRGLVTAAKNLDLLNKHISNATYFIGTTLSLADIFLFSYLYSTVKSEKSIAKYQSLLRWFDLLQNTLPVHGILEKLSLPFNNGPFVFKPLVPPASTTAPATVAAAGTAPAKATPEATTTTTATKAKATTDAKPSEEAEDKKKKKKAAQEPVQQQKEVDVSPSILDMRIGRVVSVKKHEKADKLYVEEIDVGEDVPRKICSGLVGKIPMEEIEGKDVLVMCNLKPSNMVGVASNGMVVCSTNRETGEVELVKIPENSYKIGERIVVEGHEGAPGAPNQVSKKLSKLLPLFSTNEKGEVVFNGIHRFRTQSGAILFSRFSGAEVK